MHTQDGQHEPSDESLVERIKQRDVAAFTLLFDRYAQVAFALAAHLLNPTDAEEIVQDVFLRLWNHAGQYDARRGSFRGWFMTIVRNRVMDEFNRRQQDQRLLAAGQVEEMLAQGVPVGADVVDSIWARQIRQAMLSALHELPPEQRRAIVLIYFGGFSQRELSNHLGWPLGTVKKRIRLGLQKLRSRLLKWRAREF